MVKEELGMIVILIGPPGSGKGTIAELIQKISNSNYIYRRNTMYRNE